MEYFVTSYVAHVEKMKSHCFRTSWLNLLRVRVVPGSNLGPETDYPVFRGFPQSIQAKAGIVQSTAFPVHITLSFNAINLGH
jgi:hypothetical protein